MNYQSLPWFRNQNRSFFLLDSLIFLLTPTIALFIRLDGHLNWQTYSTALISVTGLFFIIKIATLRLFNFYRRHWRYASIHELTSLAQMAGLIIVLQYFAFVSWQESSWIEYSTLPRSIPFLDGLISVILIGINRFSWRTVKSFQQNNHTQAGIPTLIIGAGMAGSSFAQEAQRNPELNIHPVGYIDDDPNKLKLQIHGIPVIGNRWRIDEIICALSVKRIIIAIPTASGQVMRELAEICHRTGISTYTLPSISEILSNRAQFSDLRKLRIEDLLRRPPIQTDHQPVRQLAAGKRILITGAGGSIGSELCRQICDSQPAEIALVGKGENSIFLIQQELKQRLAQQAASQATQANQQGAMASGTKPPKINAFIADIRSKERMDAIFRQFCPDMIFHAAAHKHVPLMEMNPPEAITNNVLGTQNLLRMAQDYNVENFVMISTDKAVNPTNVMGASKRIAEMLVLQTAKQTGRPYVVVRFGNVLGSRGSVIPTFKRQIAEGGPITVTHPEICRYFMTIPEAVQLVLQAAVLGHGGEVLMLDMGEPIKIVTLAEDLIRLSGYQVGEDIDIVFSGLRPGEKLYEELFIDGERYERTQNHKILMVHNASRQLATNLNDRVQHLATAAHNQDVPLVRSLLVQLLPEYKPSQDLGQQTDLAQTSTAKPNHPTTSNGNQWLPAH